MLTALPQLVISTLKDDKLQQFAVESAIVECILHRGFQADLEILLLVIADEPHVISLEGVLEDKAHVAVELVNVLDVEPLAIGRVADERAARGHQLDVPDVAALELDVFVHSSALDVGAGDGNRLALDVTAINLVGKFPLGAVVVVNRVEEFLVIVGPLLEGVVVTVHAGSGVGGDKRRLDEEGA